MPAKVLIQKETQPMFLQFSQSDIEGQLDDCFPYGMVNQVSIRTGISPSLLAQYLNPNDERKSPTYEFLQIQSALDNINPELGDKHWNLVESFRERSRPRKDAGLSVDTELSKAVKEDADVVVSCVTHRSLLDQLMEVQEAIAQKELLKQAILDAMNHERNSFNGQKVYTNGRG